MNYNKLPFKERKRQYDYQYNQTAKQEELLLKREAQKIEKELEDFYRKEYYKTDKDREVEEIYKQLETLHKKEVK